MSIGFSDEEIFLGMTQGFSKCADDDPVPAPVREPEGLWTIVNHTLSASSMRE